MNYFAHGRHYIASPYFLVGTAVPDMLSVVDRRVRVRRAGAEALAAVGTLEQVAVARGAAQHLVDDDWFHRTRAFAELSWAFTVAVRDVLTPDAGLRPRFLGHILVELLLDSILIAEDPPRLDAYYQAFGSVDPQVVQEAVELMAKRPAPKLGDMIERFAKARVLADYADDQKLWKRLNQVMQRVKLEPLPESLQAIFPQCRAAVAERRDELLEGESEYQHKSASSVGESAQYFPQTSRREPKRKEK